ncbi:MAG: hypothetical protein JWQ08_2594, partial [Deinococcus sp.]|nr:hypothetical protein [Deinococcus sp.]
TLPTLTARGRPAAEGRSWWRGLWSVPLLGTLSVALAAPDLQGASVCLSPMLTVLVGSENDMKLAGLADRAYAETRTLLRAAGVAYHEDQLCKRASASLTLSLSVRPMRGSSALETQVSAHVDDGSTAQPNSWLNSGGLRWSAVKYGQVGPREAEVTARLLQDTRTLLGQLVNTWKAVNR